MAYPNEKVLVFPGKSLLSRTSATGIFTGQLMHEIVVEVLRPISLMYIDRSMAEQSPWFKQVIPYGILKNGDNIFRYRRTKKSGETRLHNKWSIGIGGHVNTLDEGPTDVPAYVHALHRELMEEVGLLAGFRETLKAALYDPSDEVGKVHFGLIYLVDLEPGFKLSLRDESIDEGEFFPIAYLKNHADEFESWSRLVLRQLL